MSGKSAIEWTDATWNPVTGCSKVSPGCANCYAETISLRFGHSKLPWTPENAAENVVLHPERLDQPLRWRAPRMVFVNSMSDLFHEQVPFSYIASVYAVMALASKHTFQVLTKRPERAREWYAWASDSSRLTDAVCDLGLNEDWPGEFDWLDTKLPNVWLGVSIENSRFTWRANVLREVPAAVRFISAEPLLGSLLEGKCRECNGSGVDGYGAPCCDGSHPLDLTGIEWLIAGGESGGRTARPMHPEWARELRDACAAATVCRHGLDLTEACYCQQCEAEGHEHARPAFFFKQWGSWAPYEWAVGDRFTDRDMHAFQDGNRNTWMRYAGASPKSGGRLLDGQEWNEMPEAERMKAVA